MGIQAKAREVRGIDRVVVRDGDAIGALLTRLGAHESVLAWEERRMRREVRATANRLANFDDANLRRSARAAVAAGARVQRALEILGDDLPEHLAEAGRLRLEHKQASLEELGQLAVPPMTKDAVAGGSGGCSRWPTSGPPTSASPTPRPPSRPRCSPPDVLPSGVRFAEDGVEGVGSAVRRGRAASCPRRLLLRRGHPGGPQLLQHRLLVGVQRPGVALLVARFALFALGVHRRVGYGSVNHAAAIPDRRARAMQATAVVHRLRLGSDAAPTPGRVVCRTHHQQGGPP
jgi:hypothetical protein